MILELPKRETHSHSAQIFRGEMGRTATYNMPCNYPQNIHPFRYLDANLNNQHMTNEDNKTGPSSSKTNFYSSLLTKMK